MMRMRQRVVFLLVAVVLVITAFQVGYFDKKWSLFQRETLQDVTAELRKLGRPILKVTSTQVVLDNDVDNEWLKITKSSETHSVEFEELISQSSDPNLRFFAGKSLPPWLSRTDIMRMNIMSQNKVLGLKPIPFRDKITRVVYDIGVSYPELNMSKINCDNQCAVAKTVNDTYEIFAFHLDRVLGVNRSLPMIARNRFPKLTDNPNITIHDGKVRPIVWFEPGLLHGGKYQGDQNSWDLSFDQYLRLLKARCWDELFTNIDPSICRVPYRLIEWTRMALFDFLLQNYDRLDRFCCGYHNVSEGERCFLEHYNTACDEDPDKLMLVHIFGTILNIDRLVFIDNAGNPGRNIEQLNYKLLAGIEMFPEHCIAIIRSGLLRRMLKRSLYVDKIYWDSTGEQQIDMLIETIEKRAVKLLEFIKKENITTVPDY
ncbi:Golgi-associated kinase 1A-like [Saccoglossus kowalevskii]|uniref:Fam198-like 062 n=1 Tax=Saccoglossus kowalevskii TaxID=10224 RepID=A0A0U2T5R8_SACKO|nr:PREDICTED: protein FAM198A-like [Saccoglossus kowalevskii]ALR88602.1 fam198-like 062 [Saccoglossus kowalevskii]